MSFPANRRVKSRLIVVWMMAVSFIVPVLGGTSAARADEGLKNDARLEGYEHKTVALEVGTGWYFIIMIGMAVVGVGVMLKDAKRSPVK